MNEESEVPEDLEDEQTFPWKDVEAARKNARVQRRHAVADAQQTFLGGAKVCPKCGAAPAQLAWFYFESPKWTWEHLCGRAGWMTVCDPCRVQVEFFLEVMN